MFLLTLQSKEQATESLSLLSSYTARQIVVKQWIGLSLVVANCDCFKISNNFLRLFFSVICKSLWIFTFCSGRFSGNEATYRICFVCWLPRPFEMPTSLTIVCKLSFKINRYFCHIFNVSNGRAYRSR